MSFVPVSTVVLNQWVRILGALEKKVKRQSFEAWFKPTRFSHMEGRTLYVRVPTVDFEQMIGDRYGDHIHEAIDNLGLEIDEVKFQGPPGRTDRGPRSRRRRLCAATHALARRAARRAPGPRTPTAARRPGPRAEPL